MAAPSPAELRQALAALPLLSTEQLAEVDRVILPHCQAPGDLLRDLVNRGWLTTFQANKLNGGRGPDLLIDRYLLLGRLGSGGMGEVYKARHLELKCLRALKVIRTDRRSDDEITRRFRREMEQASKLSHPNIVTTHDGGNAGGVLFLAMELLDGTDLHQVLRNGKPGIANACLYMAQAARGLDHAFQRKLIHRDIKPSNLMLTCPGAGASIVADPASVHSPESAVPTCTLNGDFAPQVKILDFGLSRSRVTEAGDSSRLLVGTPGYMAPEQIDRPGQEDIRADIYSLGCTFYHLLAGSPPFSGESQAQVLFRNAQGVYPSLSEMNPDVPAHVVAVVERMMARDPNARYRTPDEAARALDDALARLTTEQPAATLPATASAAREATPRRLPRRFLIGGAVAGGVALLAIVLIQLLGGGGKRTEANEDRPDPSENGKVAGASQKLFRLDPATIPEEERFKGQPDELVAVLGERAGRHWGQTHCVVFSPDGKTIASGGGDGAIRLWSAVQDGDRQVLREQTVLIGSNLPVRQLAFDPQGRWLASCSGSTRSDATPSEFQVWDLKTLGTALPAQKFRDAISCCPVFAPDGSHVACGHLDGLHVWKTDDWKSGWEPEARLMFVRSLAFSNDGKKIAAGIASPHSVSSNGLRIWETETHKETPFPAPLKGDVFWMMFLRGNTHLLVAGRSGKLLKVTVADGSTEEIKRATHGSRLFSLSATQDYLVFPHAPLGHELTLWEVEKQQRWGSTITPGRDTLSVSLSPDGKRLATCGYTGLVHLWDLEGQPKERTRYRGQHGSAHSLALSPDNSVLAVGGQDGMVRLWDLTGAQPREIAPPSPLLCHGDAVAGMLFLPDAPHVFTWSKVDFFHTFHAETGKRIPSLPRLSNRASALAVSPDGKKLAFGGDNKITFYKTDKGQPLSEQLKEQPAGRPIALAWSPDGSQLASFSDRTELSVWDVAAGSPLPSWPQKVENRINESDALLKFSPDGKTLALGRSKGTVSLWNVEEGREAGAYPHHTGPVTAVVFSPDGKRLATAGEDGGLRVITLGKRGEEVPMAAFPGAIHDLVFAKDNRHLITANANGTVYIIRLPALAQ